MVRWGFSFICVYMSVFGGYELFLMEVGLHEEFFAYESVRLWLVMLMYGGLGMSNFL